MLDVLNEAQSEKKENENEDDKAFTNVDAPVERPRLRRIRLGLLGLGNVGQAVVRACHVSKSVFRNRGLDIVVDAALVRDTSKTRTEYDDTIKLTSDADAFFARDHDIVVEVLGGVEPARALIERCLCAGISVVTANKSVIAAHGKDLCSISRRQGAGLRYEASTIAGVPFLTLLRNRLLTLPVKRVCGILNGTSNFVLSRMNESGRPVETIVREAQSLGYAEPDPSLDLSGRDAAEKLCIILQHLGIEDVAPDAVETVGIESLQPADLERADTLGGVIKPVAFARVVSNGVEAFAGPAFVPNDHELARVDFEKNGVCLSDGNHTSLTLAGPGAGADVTAATIIDDIVELCQVSHNDGLTHDRTAPLSRPSLRAPSTGWFLRVEFKNNETPFTVVSNVLQTFGITTHGLVGGPAGHGDRRVYLTTDPIERATLEDALDKLRRFECSALSLRIAPFK
ncbi:MAG: homoserine dehydrogenase [Phycisphaerales bacterium]|nr:homoserine dehydrogenase [Phycisphaerales bacterium]